MNWSEKFWVSRVGSGEVVSLTARELQALVNAGEDPMIMDFRKKENWALASKRGFKAGTEIPTEGVRGRPVQGREKSVIDSYVLEPTLLDILRKASETAIDPFTKERLNKSRIIRRGIIRQLAELGFEEDLRLNGYLRSAHDAEVVPDHGDGEAEL